MGILLEELPLQMQRQAADKLKQFERAKKNSVVGRIPDGLGKYKNQKIERMGLRFDSKKEARRFEALLLRLQAGEIQNLKLQQDYTLQEAYTLPTGERVRAIRYRADFCYEQKGMGSDEWRYVVEDVKSRGTRTKEYIIKRKLMQQKYGITIQEV